MANEKSPETEKKGGKQMILIVGAVVLGLAAGGGGGLFAAQTLLADKDSPASHDGDSETSEGDKDAAGEDAPPAAVHSVSDLVLNPAESGGTRFLMVSVALGLEDATAAEQMKAREAELRDVVLGVLSRKTVAELTDVARRDSLKVELKEEVGRVFPGVQHVYFPQYVIQ